MLDLLLEFPWGITSKKLTGSDLVKACEWDVNLAPVDQGSFAIFQDYTRSQEKPKLARVTNVRVSGEPIDLEKFCYKYRISGALTFPDFFSQDLSFLSQEHLILVCRCLTKSSLAILFSWCKFFCDENFYPFTNLMNHTDLLIKRVSCSLQAFQDSTGCSLSGYPRRSLLGSARKMTNRCAKIT